MHAIGALRPNGPQFLDQAQKGFGPTIASFHFLIGNGALRGHPHVSNGA
jgi:hypothetical protein